jgi:hypothetical protein
MHCFEGQAAAVSRASLAVSTETRASCSLTGLLLPRPAAADEAVGDNRRCADRQGVEVDLTGSPGSSCPATSSRAGARTVGRVPAVARTDRDGLEGARLVPRRARARALRPKRKCRPDRVVERLCRGRLGGSQGRRPRVSPARRRRRGRCSGDRGRGGTIAVVAWRDEGDSTLRDAAREGARGRVRARRRRGYTRTATRM